MTFAGDLGLDRSLKLVMRPSPSSTTKSVNVPPASTPMRSAEDFSRVPISGGDIRRGAPRTTKAREIVESESLTSRPSTLFPPGPSASAGPANNAAPDRQPRLLRDVLPAALGWG